MKNMHTTPESGTGSTVSALISDLESARTGHRTNIPGTALVGLSRNALREAHRQTGYNRSIQTEEGSLSRTSARKRFLPGAGDAASGLIIAGGHPPSAQNYHCDTHESNEFHRNTALNVSQCKET